MIKQLTLTSVICANKSGLDKKNLGFNSQGKGKREEIKTLCGGGGPH